MAPTKNVKQLNQGIAPSTRSILTRNKTKTLNNVNSIPMHPRIKRKADASPVKDGLTKRSALGDVTNHKKVINDKAKAITKASANAVKKVTVHTKQLPSVKTIIKPKYTENIAPPAAPIQKVQTRASLRNDVNHTAQKPKEPSRDSDKENKIKTRLSDEFEKTGDSLYSSALEEISNSCQSQIRAKVTSKESQSSNITLVAQQLEKRLNLEDENVPEGVNNFDKENWNDVFQVPQYAWDIFNYLKSREPFFVIGDYMDKQVCLTRWMRSLLVDWMVEIQESFELNHETLYLGVKLVDLYLNKVLVSKETLQLVGATSMFIASKYDEHVPPSVDDFLYICDGAYTRREMLKMEINIFKVINHNLGIPLSYRFLRRYARCAKVTLPILTLARFILEHSLMDYATITVSESKLAAASLYLALQMRKLHGWNATLQYYTGYKLVEITDTIKLLNEGLHRKPKDQLMTIRNKYSHRVFFEVAKIPLIKTDDLQL